jgi:hypothetical protein
MEKTIKTSITQCCPQAAFPGSLNRTLQQSASNA